MVFLRAKCIIAGDAAVGKSTLCQVFHSDGAQNPKNYNMTTGIELLTKVVPGTISGDSVEIFMYDSAGRDVFYEFVSKQWNSPSMYIVMYDVTDPASYDSCEKYVEKLKTLAGAAVLPGVLIANKVDQSNRRVIDEADGRALAERGSLEYFECCAKDFKDAEAPFLYLAKTFCELHNDKENKINTIS